MTPTAFTEVIVQKVAESEALTKPEFIIDRTVEPKTAELLSQAIDVIEEDPMFALHALSIAHKPAPASEVLDIFEQHGEAGMKNLRTINDLWATGADKELTYDHKTESSVLNGDEFKAIQKQPDSTERAKQSRYLFLSTAIIRELRYQKLTKND